MQLKSLLAAAVVLMVSLPGMAQRLDPQVDISVPPEVFNTQGQRAAPCNQCCIYQDQNYSEGAVVKADGGVLLQCQRDEKTLSTTPLVWRRVKP
ncbi:DUF1496 domain-containing protein [Buttiauxella izardii]|uniref:DUF1496 domain-containing protein n=1 Tax=Buttiauxella izardii TaxID=82991 RepID=A0A3A5K3M8_9ENTR|nr:DUF1496 domain-containing protein [Buttiauxella izardii]RJT26964.1 DUF1496 domain-containing protein [Buttiauxella izardii]